MQEYQNRWESVIYEANQNDLDEEKRLRYMRCVCIINVIVTDIMIVIRTKMWRNKNIIWAKCWSCYKEWKVRFCNVDWMHALLMYAVIYSCWKRNFYWLEWERNNVMWLSLWRDYVRRMNAWEEAAEQSKCLYSWLARYFIDACVLNAQMIQLKQKMHIICFKLFKQILSRWTFEKMHFQRMHF